MPLDTTLKTSSELQELNRAHQTGAPEEQKEQELSFAQSQTPALSAGSALDDTLKSLSRRTDNYVEDVASQAIQAGYGQSKYDIKNPYEPGMDLEDMRAKEQSSFAKIGMGITKMGTTALTTFANTTIGTVFGAFSLGAEAVRQAVDGNLDAGGIMNAGVNNPVSEWLISLQKKADEWFPNYRTAEERTEQYQHDWIKHMGDANFIGDVFIKNLGFTLGAIAGGAMWTRAMAPLIRNASSDILKGAILAANGDSKAATEMNAAVEAWKAGRLTRLEAEKILGNIKGALPAMSKADARLQLFGSVIGAMGEGSAEGLMAKDEFKQEFKKESDSRFYQDYQNLEIQMLQEGDGRYVEIRKEYNPELNRIDDVPYLTDAGQVELQRRRNELSQKYNDYLEASDFRGDQLAATVFLLNLPVLTGANLAEFGKVFSGGWKTARKNVRGIRSNLKTAAGEAVEGYSKPILTGEVKATGNKVLRTLEKMGKVASTEAAEEMSQGAISSGGKEVAMAYFNNGGYDPGAVDSMREWYENMFQGSAEYLGDWKNWQEGFLGALTGLVGVPSFRFKAGQWWGGGIIGSAMEASREIDAERKAAEKLNTLIKDKDFQTRWHDHIRRLAYSDKMDEAAAKNDQYAWHTAENEKLINDIMSFAHAGKLNELQQFAAELGNVTEADAGRLKTMYQNDGNFTQQFEGKDMGNISNSEIVGKIREQAEKIGKAINDYKEIYDSLSARAPMDASEKFLEEMVFTEANIRQFEDRFMRMFGETMEVLEKSPAAKAELDKKVELKVDGNAELEKFLNKVNTLKSVRSVLESYFGSSPAKEVPSIVESLFNESIDAVKSALGSTGDEARQKVEDMKKLMQDRRAFYDKLRRMEDPKTTEKAQSEFKDKAITPEKVEQQAEKQHVDDVTSELRTIADMRKAMVSQKTAADRKNLQDALKSVADKNPVAKQFVAMRERQSELASYTSAGLGNVFEILSNPDFNLSSSELMSMAYSKVPFMLQRLWLHNDSADNFTSKDAVFPTYEEFAKKFKDTDQGEYGDVLDMAKAVLDAFNATRAQIDGVKDAAVPEKKETPPSPQPATQSTDKDPGAPGSTLDGPTKKQPEQKSEPRPKEESAPEPSKAEETETKEEQEAPTPENKSVAESFKDTAAGTEVTDADVKESAEERLVGGQKDFLRTGMPQVDSSQAMGARDALHDGDIEKYMSYDLSDFVDYAMEKDGSYKLDGNGNRIPVKNPSYAKIWQALADLGAFDMLKTMKVGEKVYFTYRKDFPTYKGSREILMCVERNGKLMPFSTLSRDTDQYTHLMDLRMAIEDEFEEEGYDADGQFVFSETSEIYKMLPGLIEFDSSKEGDKPIQNAGYDPSTKPALLFIDKNGQPVPLGSATKADIPEGYNEASKNYTQKVTAGKTDRRGSLYYLVPTGNGKMIPVHLNVQHFNENWKEHADSTSFDNIVRELGNIVSIAKSATERNYEVQANKLKKSVGELAKWLDLHDIDFTLDHSGPDGALAFFIKQNVDGNDTVVYGASPDGIVEDVVFDKIAELDKSLQIKTDEARTEIINWDDYVRDGFIFTNAKSLEAKGIDIRAYPFDGVSKFGPVNSADISAAAETANTYTEVESDTAEFSLDAAVESGRTYPTTDVAEDRNERLESKSDGTWYNGKNADVLSRKYSDLTDSQKSNVERYGFTQEDWDSKDKIPQPIREQIIKCA